MKTERNILAAFLLNLAFSVFELIGGTLTGSVAIISDAVHDMGDAVSIGLSFFLERKSHRPPDEVYTFGYARLSVLGSLITTLLLLSGSALVIWNAIHRIFLPVEIHYDGMILFAVLGACINILAAWFTRDGDSLNQRAVNLHMLEDVLGWVVVLIGGIVMRFTDISLLDPLMSIGVALFILFHAVKNLREILALFLEKAPHGLCAGEIREHIGQIPGIRDVHHIHLWSLDGSQNFAAMHIVTDGDPHTIKVQVRKALREHGIGHATLELESVGESCPEPVCCADRSPVHIHSHHHHHHHAHHHH